jgi:hypothetical protein
MMLFAEIFGAIAIVLFVLALMNFALKWTYRNYPKYFKKHPKYAKVHLALMKPFVKMHKWVGIGAVAAMDAHIVLAFIERGFNISGAVTAVLLLAQMFIGMFGAWAKPKSKTWLVIHRVVAISAVVALLVHGILVD